MENITELETEEELLSFIHNYCDFGLNRVYILSAMARPKENDGITHNTLPMFREIIANKSNINKKYNKIKYLIKEHKDRKNEDLKFRFYITTNARDVDKSIYLYQGKILEMNRNIKNGHKETKKKIKRIDKEWKSTLQQQGNNDDSYFIIDLDNISKDKFKYITKMLQKETEIIESIRTPNGFHIITESFEYPKYDFIEDEDIEVKTDGLMFLQLSNI